MSLPRLLTTVAIVPIALGLLMLLLRRRLTALQGGLQ
jgi:hypothetical protein